MSLRFVFLPFLLLCWLSSVRGLSYSVYSDANCSLLVSSYSFGNPNADVNSPLNTYNEVCVDVSAGQNVTNSISSVNVTCPYLGTTNGAPYYKSVMYLEWSEQCTFSLYCMLECVEHE